MEMMQDKFWVQRKGWGQGGLSSPAASTSKRLPLRPGH